MSVTTRSRRRRIVARTIARPPIRLVRRGAAAVVTAAALTAGIGAVVPSVASAAPGINCSTTLYRTVGKVTCSTGGGAYTVRDVYADCGYGQRDIHRGRWTVNGMSTMYFECRHKIDGIKVVL